MTMSTCRSRRCFMSTPGVFPGRRRLPASSRFIRADTIRPCSLKLIKSEGVTFTHGVPTILQMLLGAADAEEIDLKGLKMVIGGSALTKSLAKQALAAGVDVYAGYGMSETGPMIAIAQVKTKRSRRRSGTEIDVRTAAGLTAPLVDLRIVDPGHERRSARRQVGRRDRAARAVAHAGLLQQSVRIGGALGRRLSAYATSRRVTPDGYVRITDRIKDVIKTGGEWVSSLQIEDLDRALPRSVRGRGDRREGRQMGRAADGPRRRQDSQEEAVGETEDQGASQGVRRQRDHLEVRDPGEDPFRRQISPRPASARSTRKRSEKNTATRRRAGRRCLAREGGLNERHDDLGD